MKIKISCLIIFTLSIMILSISTNLLKKSKLLQANDMIPNYRNTSQPLSSDAKATIDVVGQARRTVKSDLIKINILIITLESTAHESMKKNNFISKELESLINSFDMVISFSTDLAQLWDLKTFECKQKLNINSKKNVEIVKVSFKNNNF